MAASDRGRRRGEAQDLMHRIEVVPSTTKATGDIIYIGHCNLSGLLGGHRQTTGRDNPPRYG